MFFGVFAMRREEEGLRFFDRFFRLVHRVRRIIVWAGVG